MYFLTSSYGFSHAACLLFLGPPHKRWLPTLNLYWFACLCHACFVNSPRLQGRFLACHSLHVLLYRQPAACRQHVMHFMLTGCQQKCSLGLPTNMLGVISVGSARGNVHSPVASTFPKTRLPQFMSCRKLQVSV